MHWSGGRTKEPARIDVVLHAHKRTTVLISAAMIIVVVVAFSYGFLLLFLEYFQIDFQKYYLDVMKELEEPETKAYMLAKINGTYNFTQLMYWTDQHLNWSEVIFPRYSTPQQILNQGKGRCEEFTIVYVSACLALGYDARIVLARQFYQGPAHGFHSWAGVKYNGAWTQVDPSPTPFWNDTSRYKNWPWGPRATLMVYAFEDDKIEDVSAVYR